MMSGGQPGQQQQPWMQVPNSIPGCPTGLEYLTQLDQILAHQVVEMLEAFIGWEGNNKYALKNSTGQQCYYAFEDTNACMRAAFKNKREFTMHVVNNFNQEVVRVYRPFKCCAGCCWCAGACDCCAEQLQVESPPGAVIGRVKQTSAGCTLNFEVQDAAGSTQLCIEGPCLLCTCTGDVEFPVLTADRTTKVGCVTKQWSGFVKEMFTQADNFGITFPLDLDVKMKATLLGAMFLIDFMAFEQAQNSSNNSGHNNND